MELQVVYFSIERWGTIGVVYTDDEVLATAMLDRILYRCEVIKLEGDSYRMENRKNIFTKE